VRAALAVVPKRWLAGRAGRTDRTRLVLALAAALAARGAAAATARRALTATTGGRRRATLGGSLTSESGNAGEGAERADKNLAAGNHGMRNPL